MLAVYQIMAVAIVVNILVSRYLLKVSRDTDSVALEADARHLTTDVMTMVGVLVGLIIVRLTGINIIDPIIAMLVALLIIKTAYDILTETEYSILRTNAAITQVGIIIRSWVWEKHK